MRRHLVHPGKSSNWVHLQSGGCCVENLRSIEQTEAPIPHQNVKLDGIAGTSPVKKLPCNVRFRSAFNFENSVGIVPSNKLRSSPTLDSNDNKPISVGSVVKLFTLMKLVSRCQMRRSQRSSRNLTDFSKRSDSQCAMEQDQRCCTVAHHCTWYQSIRCNGKLLVLTESLNWSTDQSRSAKCRSTG